MLRLKNNQLKLPVISYINPITNKKVILMGVMHIAEAEYYEQLKDIIKLYESNNYKILYEMVQDIPYNKKIKLEEIEQKLLNNLDSLSESYDKISKLMDLKLQKDWIEYKDDWINSDITNLELVRLFIKHNIKSPFKKIDTKLFEDLEKNKEMVCYIVNYMLKFFPIITKIFGKSKSNKIIIDYRNKIAFNAIMNTNGNVLSIYGTGHLVGIEKMLLNNGFKKVEENWLTAYSVRNYKLTNILKELDWKK